MKKFSVLLLLITFSITITAQKPYVLLKSLTDHNAPVECMKVSPDGKYAISADRDGYLIFWDVVDSMKMIHKVRGHNGGINCLIFNKSGSKFVTAGDDGKVKLWNFHTMKPINGYVAPYNSVNFAVLAPDERSIYFGGYRRTGTSYSEGNQFTGLYQVDVTGSSDPVLLFDDETTTSSGYSYTTNTWGITDGNLDASRQYIVFTKGYYVYFWDIDKGKLAFKRSSTTNLNNLYCTSSAIYLWGDGYISKLSVSNGYTVSKTFAGTNNPENSGYSAFAFSNNGKYMVTGDDDNRVNVWSTYSLSKVQVLLGHTDVARGFAFANHDSMIVSVSYDGTLRLWGYQEIKDRIDSLDKIVPDTNTVVMVDTIVRTYVDTLPLIVKDTAEIIKDVIFAENNIPVKIKDRDVELQKTITVSQPEFDIEIWDRSVVDGDSISLNLNGEWILTEYMVVKAKKKIHIKLNPNYTNNYIILYAHNLGSISPNTAAVQVIIDGKAYKLTLNSSLDKSGALNFEYKPDN